MKTQERHEPKLLFIWVDCFLVEFAPDKTIQLPRSSPIHSPQLHDYFNFWESLGVELLG